MKANLKVHTPRESEKTPEQGSRFLDCLGEFLAGTDNLLSEQLVMGSFPLVDKETSKN